MKISGDTSFRPVTQVERSRDPGLPTVSRSFDKEIKNRSDSVALDAEPSGWGDCCNRIASWLRSFSIRERSEKRPRSPLPYKSLNGLSIKDVLAGKWEETEE